jgi:hypothetical protein
MFGSDDLNRYIGAIQAFLEDVCDLTVGGVPLTINWSGLMAQRPSVRFVYVCESR